MQIIQTQSFSIKHLIAFLLNIKTYVNLFFLQFKYKTQNTHLNNFYLASQPLAKLVTPFFRPMDLAATSDPVQPEPEPTLEDLAAAENLLEELFQSPRASPDSSRVSSPDPDNNMAAVNVRAIKVPDYSPQHADMFFGVLEDQFRFHEVPDEQARYTILTSLIPFGCLSETAANLVRNKPAATPYSTLKAAILEPMHPVEYTSAVRARLRVEPIGDSKPSEFKSRLLRLVGPVSAANVAVMSEVREHWTSALPSWSPLIVLEPDFDRAASNADTMHAYDKQRAAAGGVADPFALTKAPAASAAVFAAAAAALPGAALPPAPYSLVDQRIEELAKQMTRLADAVKGLQGEVRSRSNHRNNNNNHHGNNNNNSNRNNNFRSTSRGSSPSAQGRNANRGRSASRGRQGELCYYHHKFGSDAYKCAPGCPHYAQYQANNASSLPATASNS